MPPQRTVPPSKAIKTERTHEENQERAYIAASRRSDRSLEARVESARRASEIHKRRTGRSLRVTEQDVVNEEMYEEEDDDLPMQYRRLTAHLQTGSADFNRRLSAYLTNHVAMRSALDQAITNSYAQQYPHAPQFAHNHHRMYPSPMMAHNMPQQQSATPYVQAPYNVATGTPGFRHVQHVRSTSIAGPLDASGYPQNVPSMASPGQSSAPGDPRQMSMPARTASSPGTSSAAQTSPFTQPKPPLQHAPSSYTGKQQMSSMLGATPGEQRKGQTEHQTPSPPQPQPAYGSLAGYPSFGPLSAALPVESQMFLGSVLDPNDPFTSMLMGGSENMMQPYYTSSPTALSKPSNFHPSYEGMSATLAPSALDMSPPNVASLPPATPGTLSTTPPLSLGFPDGLADFKGQVFTRSNSSHGSGTVTPAIDGGWDAFINDNSWSENPT